MLKNVSMKSISGLAEALVVSSVPTSQRAWWPPPPTFASLARTSK
ncbi:hypothetical protein [Nonomuraea dietziae]